MKYCINLKIIIKLVKFYICEIKENLNYLFVFSAYKKLNKYIVTDHFTSNS